MRLAIGNRTGRAAWLKAIAVSMIVVFAGALHAADKSAAPAPVIDNDRVVVWNLHLNKGEAGPYTPKDLDTVVVFLKGGSIRSESSDGHVHLEKRRAGDAVWVPKGSPLRDTPTSEEPVDEVVISLKDTPVEPLVNSSGLPLAFPRPGSKQVLENARVIVWQYSWVSSRPTPMHFHDKDAVVAFREEGTLQSVSPTGERTANTAHPGEIRFNPRNRSHSEQLISGRQSAVAVELK